VAEGRGCSGRGLKSTRRCRRVQLFLFFPSIPFRPVSLSFCPRAAGRDTENASETSAFAGKFFPRASFRFATPRTAGCISKLEHARTAQMSLAMVESFRVFVLLESAEILSLSLSLSFSGTNFIRTRWNKLFDRWRGFDL